MILQVKVQPSSSKKKIMIMPDGSIKVYLHSAPEKNKANKELIEFLASKLCIRKTALKIIKGETSRTKTIEAAGINEMSLKKLT